MVPMWPSITFAVMNLILIGIDLPQSESFGEFAWQVFYIGLSTYILYAGNFFAPLGFPINLK